MRSRWRANCHPRPAKSLATDRQPLRLLPGERSATLPTCRTTRFLHRKEASGFPNVSTDIDSPGIPMPSSHTNGRRQLRTSCIDIRRGWGPRGRGAGLPRSSPTSSGETGRGRRWHVLTLRRCRPALLHVVGVGRSRLSRKQLIASRCTVLIHRVPYTYEYLGLHRKYKNPAKRLIDQMNLR